MAQEEHLILKPLVILLPELENGQMCKHITKRICDIILAILGLAITSPLWVCSAIAVLISMGTPVMFSQWRAGIHGKPFRMLKFRTMRDTRDEHGQLLPDEQRLTRLGRFLRRTSLDELPELINVIQGEMSIVGPRPLLMDYLPLYTPAQMRRHEVTPGITGWAQVNGRNTLSWEERFELDVWYVDNWSMMLDLRILLMTIRVVFTGKGISADGHATMPDFQGTVDRSAADSGGDKGGLTC